MYSWILKKLSVWLTLQPLGQSSSCSGTFKKCLCLMMKTKISKDEYRLWSQEIWLCFTSHFILKVWLIASWKNSTDYSPGPFPQILPMIIYYITTVHWGDVLSIANTYWAYAQYAENCFNCFNGLTPLILMANLWGRHSSLHFRIEKAKFTTEVQKDLIDYP